MEIREFLYFITRSSRKMINPLKLKTIRTRMIGGTSVNINLLLTARTILVGMLLEKLYYNTSFVLINTTLRY